MEMRDQQKLPEGLAEQQASNEPVNMIHKLRVMGLNDEAISLDKSVRCRELREIIGRGIKAHSDLAELIPERLTELIDQLVQRINEREKEPGEAWWSSIVCRGQSSWLQSWAPASPACSNRASG
jgi:hypothetical protein